MSTDRSAPHPAAAAAVLAPARLAALRRTALLEGAADGTFDRFTRLASRLLGVSVALVSLVDADRQVFAGSVGLTGALAAAGETPLSHSFCQHVVALRAPLIVPDARSDPLLADNPALFDGIVAYVGVPITAEGEIIGTLCAADGIPRPWSDDDVAALEDLATSVEVELAHRVSRVAIAEVHRTAARLLAASPDGFIALDRDGRCTYVSTPLARALGTTPTELIGVEAITLVPPAERPGVLALIARVHATRGPVRAEMQLTVPGGTARRWIALRAVPDGDGVAVALRDVTTRHDAEDALRQSESRYRALVEQSPEPVFVHRDGRLLYANSAAGRLLGIADLTAFVGQDLYRWLHPDERDAARRQLEVLVSGAKEPEPRSYRLVRADGSEIEIEALSVRLDGEPGVSTVQTLCRDVTERNRLQRDLTHQAFHDPLTGLANRARLLDRSRHALTRTDRGEHVALLFLDLDDFKQINDSRGHAAGDQLLRSVAGRLQHATRGLDTVARLGGDEFAVLLEGLASRADADAIVARITQTLREPVPLDGGAAVPRASVGLVHATPGATADDLLRDADTAMYAAKAAGKGHTVTFAPSMRHALLDRLTLEQDLHGVVSAIHTDVDAEPATGAGQLSLEYQPIVALHDGALVKFEALLRWNHPVRGQISPATFIPLAESTGLIVALGRWVLREACCQLRAWNRAGAAAGHRQPVAQLAINLSGRQLEDPGLVSDIGDTLREFGVDAAQITLEVTETALMRDLGGALATLHALKALGVCLAVDDFGIGYSSLAYLHRFPVDVLKIDRAFVDRIADDGPEAALARTVIALGHTLGLQAVAEGVETDVQRQALLALGCPFAQGYLFSRPLRAGKAWELMTGAPAGSPAGAPPPPSSPS